MAIGRTDERQKPSLGQWQSHAAKLSWVSSAEPIWASGHQGPHKQAGHMTAFEPPQLSYHLLLELRGPSTHDPPRHVRQAPRLLPGGRGMLVVETVGRIRRAYFV
jgi:hypothetical protein